MTKSDNTNSNSENNKITESQWMEICGLLTLSRDYQQKIRDIESIIKEKYPFIDGYFCDEEWGSTSLIEVRQKWLKNPLINFTIKEEKTE